MPTTGSNTPDHRATHPLAGGAPRRGARRGGALARPPASARSGTRQRGAPENRRSASRPAGGHAEPLGALLAGLRANRGWSQPRLARRLCDAAGVPTISRNEISRWERQLRVPGPFWLGWLATVLGAPLDELMAARRVAASAGRARDTSGAMSATDRAASTTTAPQPPRTGPRDR